MRVLITNFEPSLVSVGVHDSIQAAFWAFLWTMNSRVLILGNAGALLTFLLIGFSNQIGNLAEHPEASALALENLQPSSENKVLSLSNSMFDQAKQNLSSEAPQDPVAQDVPGNNSFGLMPSILGSQFVQLEGPEVQTRDVSRPSNFMVSPMLLVDIGSFSILA